LGIYWVVRLKQLNRNQKKLFKKEKIMKIFLIEDDPIQVEWARKSLAGYDLEIATNVMEGREILKAASENDLIISDLELSNKKREDAKYDYEWQPSMLNGLEFFKEGVLSRLVGGKVKGVAMISNFEHHVAEDDENESYYQKIKAATDILAAVGKHRDDYLVRVFGCEAGLNLVCFVDEHIDTYKNFFFKGEYLSEEEVEKRFSHREYMPKYNCCKLRGGILLKKYKEAVELLLK
jgi:CheY-like chemotaxis protein